MQARAKEVESLRDKLTNRKSPPDANVTELKDLAGCRAIFYTNTDVERFLGSELSLTTVSLPKIRVPRTSSSRSRE